MTATHSSYSLLRQTLRRLTRERGFTATVLLTLALCIGANVAMYAVIDAILVRALPYPNAERLVTTINSYPGAGAERVGASLPNYYDRREGMESFESTSIFQGGSAILGEAGSPSRIARGRVSPEFFDTLGVPLAMGRTFTDDDMLYASAQILILTHEFWQSQYDGDPDILGQKIMVDSLENTVVGVLTPGFQFLGNDSKFFIPLASNLEDREVNRRHSNSVQLYARLKAGVTVEEAQLEMDTYNEVLAETDPFASMVANAGYRTYVYGLHADTVRQARPILLILQAGALSLLLIGIVNLVNLLLIRAKGREKETAVRQALGAGRRQLAKEITIETVSLAVLGGFLGLGIGAIGIRLLDTLGTDQLPLGASIAFDGRVALISLIGSFVVGLALALPIVLVNARRNLSPALQSESRSGTVSRGAQNARYVFIVAQVAIAFTLLSGAGLLGLSLQKVLGTSPGFKTDEVLTAQLSLPWKNYPEPQPRQEFLDRLLGELRSTPGVQNVGFTNLLPFSGNANNNATVVEGIEVQPGDSIRTHYTGFAMGDYWQAMGIALIEGRYLEDGDNLGEQRVCLVDEAFAQRYWPGESALGHRLASDVEINEDNAVTIVGVVSTVKLNDLTDITPLGTIYAPYKQRPSQGLALVVSTMMDPSALINTLRNTVLAIDPELPIDDILVMQERIDNSLVTRRSPAILAGIFASVALLLAAIGTYGVLAYAVSQRRREIGVRIALGALPSVVLRQFLGLGIRLLVAGIAIGLVGTWLAGLGMKSVLFDVETFHTGIVSLTAVIMSIVVLFAVLTPSRRAARVSPMEAMRDD